MVLCKHRHFRLSDSRRHLTYSGSCYRNIVPNNFLGFGGSLRCLNRLTDGARPLCPSGSNWEASRQGSLACQIAEDECMEGMKSQPPMSTRQNPALLQLAFSFFDLWCPECIKPKLKDRILALHIVEWDWKAAIPELESFLITQYLQGKFVLEASIM